ncbi:MAG: ABC transporter ATP-binding protein, partial [Proteobacteria bacterium]|nr:ABC transporter ATP-binding protein [Pseudomonadota bacterium]
MLEIEHLVTGYGGVPVLHDVSLRLAAGEVVGLLGANNAGKTTLINSLSAMYAPMSGRILFEGQDITAVSPQKRVELGIVQVPEGRLVFPEMSVRENLLLGGINRRARAGRSRQMERVLELFPRLQERLSQNAGTLSGGEQQMLAIGRALMAEARLLMLDEPSLGLSPLFVQYIFEIIDKLHAAGLTILLVE